MAQFQKRFDYRNHVAGQLVTKDELLEIQKLQYQTYCNIEADRYGLNPDGSFTPHVISGLVPSIVTGQQQIRISRGHGWITRTLSNYDERIPIVLEDDLLVDIPGSDGADPYWCHVLLENLVGSIDEAYGYGSAVTKDVDSILHNVPVPLYVHSVGTTAKLSPGTPAVAPTCNVVIGSCYLPIATVYIPAGSSGEIDAADLYDVRWFAPGYGKFAYVRTTGETVFNLTRNWQSIRETVAIAEGAGGCIATLGLPSNDVFPLIPDLLPNISASGGEFPASKLMAAELLPITSATTNPIATVAFNVGTFETDGSGIDVTIEKPKWISVEFNPVV